MCECVCVLCLCVCVFVFVFVCLCVLVMLRWCPCGVWQCPCEIFGAALLVVLKGVPATCRWRPGDMLVPVPAVGPYTGVGVAVVSWSRPLKILRWNRKALCQHHKSTAGTNCSEAFRGVCNRASADICYRPRYRPL